MTCETCDRMKPVVDAAVAWVAASPEAVPQATQALEAAVEKYTEETDV